MKRKAGIIGVVALLMIMILAANAGAADGKAESLTIKGDGVSREITFSRAELERMSPGITQNTYSAVNNFPTRKVLYRKGVDLFYLLEKAGVKDNAQLLTFISSDGYTRSFTLQELKQERYYFGTDGRRTSVPTIIAFADSSKGYDTMTDLELTLTMGQRVKDEQNNPWFVKYLQTIEVSTAAPEQWPQVTFTRTDVPEGIAVKCQHPNFDLVKIYYTLDGSQPTLNSTLYNVSASYYQPELNKPIIITGNTVIKAIAIGAGKRDSLVTTVNVTIDDAATDNATTNNATVFSDLHDFSWAKEAVEALAARGIISGMGDQRFAPEQSLTRAQFATIVVLALGEKPVQGTTSSFRDVESTDWYYGYVEKAAAMGLINGYPDTTFRPDNILSRQEMLTIIVQAAGVKPAAAPVSDMQDPFINETRISDWARGYVARAENLGILEHGHLVRETSQGLSFDALREANRAEAAVTVYRMLEARQ